MYLKAKKTDLHIAQGKQATQIFSPAQLREDEEIQTRFLTAEPHRNVECSL